MYILGISAFYHDSAAVLIKDGRVVCALEEERLTRIKHDNSFPFLAINKCLEIENITINQIDFIAYYEKPLLKFERILENIVKDFPYSLKTFIKALPEWLGSKIKVSSIIRSKLKFKKEIFFIPHHLSHASAAFYPSPYEKSAVLTIDGVGEYQTTALWLGDGNKIRLIKDLNFPDSLGLLYSVFTSFLGFRVNEDEYKVMGLSAYGKPVYKEKIYQLMDLKSDGSFKLNSKYFNFESSETPWSQDFEKLFGKNRQKNNPFFLIHKNIAASIQFVTEEIYFKILTHLHSITETDNICIGGGVGLNALANGKIYSKTPFKNVYVFGAAGDSGGALGAALFTWNSILDRKIRNQIKTLKLGTSYNNQTIRQILDEQKISYKKFSTQAQLINQSANLLAKGSVIGWFQGKMEFGPRALGGRSILASPKHPSMKTKVNTVKLREQFRPFAGSVLVEKVNKLFDVPEKNYFSPFMNFCFKVKSNQKHNVAAITHMDQTCRIQTVTKKDGIYYLLIKKFAELTGIPCLLNTSFNLAGEPIVHDPKQAINDFQKSRMEYLVLNNFILKK